MRLANLAFEDWLSRSARNTPDTLRGAGLPTVLLILVVTDVGKLSIRLRWSTECETDGGWVGMLIFAVLCIGS